MRSYELRITFVNSKSETGVSVWARLCSEAGQLTDALVCLTAGLPARLLTKPTKPKLKSDKLVPPVDTNTWVDLLRTECY